jgi:N-acetylmuramoyl-L-alanine amidase CwlA
MSTGAAGVETGSQVQSTYTEMNKTDKTDSKKPRYYGKQIGSPVLSEEGEKYYEQLKKKFGNMEFILVSKDMKQQAKTMAASFANPYKTVVLIDEEKIEKMATDENFRKQYESIISNAKSGLSKLKSSIEKTGARLWNAGEGRRTCRFLCRFGQSQCQAA